MRAGAEGGGRVVILASKALSRRIIVPQIINNFYL